MLKPMASNIRLQCVITSDNHMDVKHPNPQLLMHFTKESVKDAKTADAYITVGDTTSRSTRKNWALVKKCFAGSHVRTIFAQGNHDTWNDKGFPAALDEYYRGMKEICGEELEHPYFSRKINGYTLIFLATTDDSGCGANMGAEEMAWLETEMAEASKDGKPIFVFCHQSFNGHHGLPRTWETEDDPNRDFMEGGIGKESDTVHEILCKYPKVYFFSGHSHMGLAGSRIAKRDGWSSFECDGNLTLINLPSAGGHNHCGETRDRGWGMILEAYDDKVVIRPRDFFHHHTNTAIMIKDGKPYWMDKL